MDSKQMANGLFDGVTSQMTFGIIPDVKTAMIGMIVIFVGYAAIDIIWGQVIADTWAAGGRRQEADAKSTAQQEKWVGEYKHADAGGEDEGSQSIFNGHKVKPSTNRQDLYNRVDMAAARATQEDIEARWSARPGNPKQDP
jgi:hypothetical protein